MFLEEAPWLWTACWLDLQEAQSQQMMAGGEEMLMMGEAEPMLLETQLASEKTVLEQVAELASTIVQLENLWLTEAEIRQEIDAADWQRFMEDVYQNLYNLATEVSDKK
ncbi:MAG: hypothetical protein GX298_10050 [Planctomycetes bacterium]|nr:hypothetical protein [Planctomycetota bacterium]